MCVVDPRDTARCNALQIREATEGFNRWVTGVALGYDPTNEECLVHYHNHGGPTDFRRRVNESFAARCGAS